MSISWSKIRPELKSKRLIAVEEQVSAVHKRKTHWEILSQAKLLSDQLFRHNSDLEERAVRKFDVFSPLCFAETSFETIVNTTYC